MLLLLPMYFLFTVTRAQQSDEVLQKSWEKYKSTFITSDGAVRRLDQGNDVVSEGVAYAMLRAVLMNDQSTFDRVYAWTESHMSRTLNPDLKDNLLAWKYTDKVADWGAASDADLDYALALAFASKKWSAPGISNLPGYTQKSLAVQQDILHLETGKAGGKLHLQPGTWNMFTAPVIVNPSYISPAHYKVFNQMKADSRWNELLDTGYDVLHKSSQEISGVRGVGLPANWVSVKDDGSVVKADNFDINYTYDAFRTSFRVALDYMWFGDARAKQYLLASGGREFLKNQYAQNSKVFAEYSHDGNSIGSYDNAGVYGVNMGWFVAEDRDVVSQFNQKIEAEYERNNGAFLSSNSYYMENWAWFGYALGTNRLPNLYASTQAPAAPTQSPELFNPVIGDAVEHTIDTQFDTSALEYMTGLHIMAPVGGEKVNGTVTMKVFNDDPQSVGTWWSVDTGGWVTMQKSSIDHVYTYDIDFSGWNWREDGTYTLHAWSFDSSEQVRHTKVVIKR